MFLSLGIVLFLIFIAVVPYAFQKKGNLPELWVKKVSGDVRVYSPEKGSLTPLKENARLSLYDRIYAGKDGTFELAAGKGITLQVKPNSEIKITHADWFVREAFYSITVDRGTVMVQNREEGSFIQIAVPFQSFRFNLQHLEFELMLSAPVVTLKSGLFLIQFDRATQSGWMGFLQGAADVRAGLFTEFLKMKDAEKVEFQQGKLLIPTNLTRSEWAGKAA